jgi:hypothetical protein
MDRQLADAFDRRLQEVLTAAEYRAVVQKNREEYRGKPYCASQEVLDANMIMADAFAEVYRRPVEVDLDCDVSRWNTGWGVWRSVYCEGGGR